jgi:hypothetical protein
MMLYWPGLGRGASAGGQRYRVYFDKGSACKHMGNGSRQGSL